MSAAGELPASPQAAHDARFDCLEAPVRGAARVRAYLVDRLKRAAIRRLHRNVHGERWVLRMYLIGEEATECALHEDWTGQPPDWLAPRIEQHLADERRHAAAFADALRERGVAPSAAPHGRLVEPAQDHAMAPACAAPCAAFLARRARAGLCDGPVRGTDGDARARASLRDDRRCPSVVPAALARARRRDAACPALLGHAAPSGCARGSASRRVAERDPRDRGRFRRDGALAMVAAGWFQSLRPRA